MSNNYKLPGGEFLTVDVDTRNGRLLNGTTKRVTEDELSVRLFYCNCSREEYR